MRNSSAIQSVKARQVFSDRGHPGVETTVTTENGAVGKAVATAGVSIGVHEVQFVYDGGEKWSGRGVMKAVNTIAETITPAIIGKDASRQWEIDEILIDLDGTPNKANLGGNTTASVSAAVLKAGASSLGIPLYQHIGGTNACILPTPGNLAFLGSRRYGGGERGGGKPSYEFTAYGFDSFAEASHALYQLTKTFRGILVEKYGLTTIGTDRCVIPPGIFKHDSEIWDLMLQTVEKTRNEGKIGFQVDVAAATYYNQGKKMFEGLFSAEDKTREDLMDLYHTMVKNYPFVVIEDPLDEIDYEGHAILTKELGIQVVGDDLFTTNVERLKEGLEIGACNTVLLKVNQIGTISEAFNTVNLAHSKGYGVMPCSSRGEGADIADYAVGLGTGSIRGSGLNPTSNRFLEIEEELGSRARFSGKDGYKTGPVIV